jgi:hypothetical protein
MAVMPFGELRHSPYHCSTAGNGLTGRQEFYEFGDFASDYRDHRSRWNVAAFSNRI